MEGLLPLDYMEETPGTVLRKRPYSKEIMEAIDSVTFIAEHLKSEDRDSSVSIDLFFSALCMCVYVLYIQFKQQPSTCLLHV